jgi:hypothetical protein
MISSQNIDTVLSLYRDERTVFKMIDIAMLVKETDLSRLCNKLNYYVKRGQIENPRKGIYTKPGYNPEELACILYTPSYISLDYVLQKSGVIFQYNTQITAISYLSRIVETGHQSYRYRKIKPVILVNPAGISRQKSNINTAVPERAFLDMLYLDPNCYFDNINPLDFRIIKQLLPVYHSEALNKRVNKLFSHA